MKFEIDNHQKKIMDNLINNLKKKIIPKRYPRNIINCFGSFEYRDKIIKIQGFSLITKRSLNELIKYIGNKKCLEIMAGTGSLSYYLNNKGIDIVATDNCQWQSDGRWGSKPWCNIEQIDCIDAIEKYRDREVIIISWPYMDSNAYRSLLKMREVNPNAKMIYIGEWIGGCTANDNFFEEINVIDDININNANEYYNSWIGIYDRIYLVN